MHQRFFFPTNKNNGNNMFLIQALFIFFLILIIIIMLKITKRSFTIVISLYSQSQYAFIIIRAYSNQAWTIFFTQHVTSSKSTFNCSQKFYQQGTLALFSRSTYVSVTSSIFIYINHADLNTVGLI